MARYDATKFAYVKGQGTFLIHSTLFWPTTGKADGESTLGKSLSHGCVRVSRSEAKWIYQNLGKGTVVVVDDRAWNNLNMVP